jgi:hypothetical protein
MPTISFHLLTQLFAMIEQTSFIQDALMFTKDNLLWFVWMFLAKVAG